MTLAASHRPHKKILVTKLILIGTAALKSPLHCELNGDLTLKLHLQVNKKSIWQI